MVRSLNIINKDSFIARKVDPQGVGTSTLKYKEDLVEVNIYQFNKDKVIYLREPKTQGSIKTYFIYSGCMECVFSGERFDEESLIILKFDSDTMNLRAVEETKILVHSYFEDSFRESTVHNEKAHRIIMDIQNKDAYTNDHCSEVTRLLKKVAIDLGYSIRRLRSLMFAARYHDLGKIFIPDEILNKPGKLTEEEYNIMKEHVTKAEDIILEDFGKEVYDMVVEHHERSDGSGYPYGLVGNEISEEGMLIAICDSYHAMISDRVYKNGKSKPDAIAELRELAGVKYNRNLVEAVIKVILEES